MFTGIIETSADIFAVVEGTSGRRLTLSHKWTDLKAGESIAVNGVCLTVANFDAKTVSFDVIVETLSKTNLGQLRPGDRAHVERALRIGDRIDGHFVQGHVDGHARLIERLSTEKEFRLAIEAPPELAKYLAPKGSVCIDGVSLTIAAVRGQMFEVALIPTTLQLTLLGDRPAGWLFNLETDIFSKTIVGWLERSGISGTSLAGATLPR